MYGEDLALAIPGSGKLLNLESDILVVMVRMYWLIELPVKGILIGSEMNTQ